MSEPGLVKGEDGMKRCGWYGGHADYMAYHDKEWGFPITNDYLLFEKICLEGFQAGLSWLTILRKRENFRSAFSSFDFRKVAKFGGREKRRLLADTGIVRHKGKVEAAIHNARLAVQLKKEAGTLATFFWQYEPASAGPSTIAKKAASERMSKDLKARGWAFVGPTTCYAFMQSIGLVNDHLAGCHVRQAVEQARAKLRRPVS